MVSLEVSLDALLVVLVSFCLFSLSIICVAVFLYPLSYSSINLILLKVHCFSRHPMMIPVFVTPSVFLLSSTMFVLFTSPSIDFMRPNNQCFIGSPLMAFVSYFWYLVTCVCAHCFLQNLLDTLRCVLYFPVPYPVITLFIPEICLSSVILGYSSFASSIDSFQRFRASFFRFIFYLITWCTFSFDNIVILNKWW